MSRFAEELKSRNIQATEIAADTRRKIALRFFTLSVIGDTLVVFGALIFAFSLVFQTGLVGIGSPEPRPTLSAYAPYMAVIGLALMLVLAHYGIYHSSQLLQYHKISFLVIKVCVIWFIAVLFITRMIRFPVSLSTTYLNVAGVTLIVALLCWRFVLFRISTLETFSRHLRDRILFVGWNDLSERLARFVMNDPAHAYTIAGCVPYVSGVYEKPPRDDIPHVAAYHDLVSMLRAKSIDIVILADRSASMQEIDDLSTICEKEMVQLKVIPSYFQILITGLSLQTISGIPILGISQLPLDRPVNLIIKRTVDIVGSIVGLILSAPIVLVFGIWVYLESPGPIFYRQRRLGRNGRSFDIIKIRSMKLDAEVGGKPGWTVKDDPRRLKIGAFMRAWNIDELPQFWNVLTGEMSLVGPRPERPELIASFKEEITHYNARHAAKPGITGWAAINGLRGDTSLSERIQSDLYYLENWSVWLDFQIMFLTFFRTQNAG